MMNPSLSPKLLDGFRSSLLDRRTHLALMLEQTPTNANFRELLREVDAALSRISAGNYGACEICNERIKILRLYANPLLRFCLSHITTEDRQQFEESQQLASRLPGHKTLGVHLAIEEMGEGGPPRDTASSASSSASEQPSFGRRLILAINAAWRTFSGRTQQNHASPYLDGDLDRASVIQSKMLPGRWLRLDPWEIYYTYTPLVEVGGDYCDLIPAESGRLFFFLGDAVGKGISASLIASQLHALFRTLASLASPFEQMAERANRIFCESMATGHYATVICGHALPDGNLELVNTGHPPPLLLRSGQVAKLDATGLPLGLFYTSKYDIARIQLAQGETLLFYTDGVTEARNNQGVEYGCERLAHLAGKRYDLIPEELVHACLSDLSTFTTGSPRSDDLTMMAMRRH